MRIKSFIILAVSYCVEACNELAGPISASLRSGNTQLLSKKMLQQWRAIGNSASDLTSTRFEPQTSRSRDECATARPFDLNARIERFYSFSHYCLFVVLSLRDVPKKYFEKPKWRAQAVVRGRQGPLPPT